MEKGTISKATLGRLPIYLNYLYLIDKKTTKYISATTIAKELNLGEVQVRKDLNSVSGAGKPKIGYEIVGLIATIETCLCYKHETKAIIVGAGNLGLALLEYDGFNKYGINIVAAFDIRKNIESKSKIILPVSDLEEYVKKENIKIGIITVEKNSAQMICDLLIKAGITAIWNFAPCKLKVSKDIKVCQENLALSLAHLVQQNIN